MSRQPMQRLSIAIGLCLWSLCGAIAWADWEQSNLLHAEDAGEHDDYGLSVAATADRVLIGAVNSKYYGWVDNAAYIVDVMTGQQQHKLLPVDAETKTRFGKAVAMIGNIAVVGAWADNDVAPQAGAIYVFDATTAERLHKFTADDGAEEHLLGYSVATNGSVVLGGALKHDASGEYSGAAYLFDLATGDQLHKLTPDDPAVDHEFGRAVAVNGQIAIISAPGDAGAGEDTGAAYLFDLTTGEQLHKLTADDSAEEDAFGSSVSISDTIAIIGAPFNGVVGQRGAVYLFDLETGDQLQKIVPTDPGNDHLFGWSVGLHGSLAVVGAPGDDYYRGAAYLYDVDNPESPLLVKKLKARDGMVSDHLGHSVGIADGVIVAGAPFSDEPAESAGSAYLFEACGADVYGDGVVDVDDLLTVLSLWGTGDVYADVNGDDIVDVLDLLMVLGNWGPCD